MFESENREKRVAMTTKLERLVNLLDEVNETLTSIQKERFKLNADEVALKTKKKITDENFRKLIKLKNGDFNTILTIKNEMLASDSEAYKNEGIEDKIVAINKCFDQTFAIVDQMKRETEFLENASTEDESMEADKTNEGFGSKDDSNSYGDSNSNPDDLIPGKL